MANWDLVIGHWECGVVIILLGPPGAGKGTQAQELKKRLGIAHVASGDLFRKAMEEGTELGLVAKSYIDRGALVSDEVTIAMILERLDEPDCRNGVILDGFPRTIEQAKALEEALAERGEAIAAVLHIRVSNKAIVERLSGRRICRNCQANYHVVFNPPKRAGVCDLCGGELYQREDDRPETVRKRLEVYLAQTAPLIEYYREAGLLTEIDGEQDIEGVIADLMAAIERSGFRG